MKNCGLKQRMFIASAPKPRTNAGTPDVLSEYQLM
jgi:hypothetical protein